MHVFSAATYQVAWHLQPRPDRTTNVVVRTAGALS